MAWLFNDLALASTSVVINANDSAGHLSLQLFVSPTERKQLQEMAAWAGQVTSYQTALGSKFNVDTTGGANLIYVSSNAPTYMDSGWYAVESITDSWDGAVMFASMRLELARVAGPTEAQGVTTAASEFLAHDF